MKYLELFEAHKTDFYEEIINETISELPIDELVKSRNVESYLGKKISSDEDLLDAYGTADRQLITFLLAMPNRDPFYEGYLSQYRINM